MIALDTSSTNISDWEKTLTEDGWFRQEGTTVGTNLRELDSVLRKDFTSNDINLITVPRLNFDFKGVIFITGKLSLAMMPKKIDIIELDF